MLWVEVVERWERRFLGFGFFDDYNRVIFFVLDCFFLERDKLTCVLFKLLFGGISIICIKFDCILLRGWE